MEGWFKERSVFWEKLGSIWGTHLWVEADIRETAGLVVFARGPKPKVPHLLPRITYILGSGNLHRISPGCQRVRRKDGRR